MTSKELRDIRFETVRKGYDPDRVDAIMERAADQIDQLNAEKQKADQKMAVLAEKLEQAGVGAQAGPVLQWLDLGEDAEAWLEFSGEGAQRRIQLRAIDPDIDFSYDFQDLEFRRVADCP